MSTNLGSSTFATVVGENKAIILSSVLSLYSMHVSLFVLHVLLLFVENFISARFYL